MKMLKVSKQNGNQVFSNYITLSVQATCADMAPFALSSGCKAADRINSQSRPDMFDSNVLKCTEDMLDLNEAQR